MGDKSVNNVISGKSVIGTIMAHPPAKDTYFLALAGMVQWIEHQPKCHWFDSQSGYMPGLWARSPVGALKRQPHIDVFLPLRLPPFPYL